MTTKVPSPALLLGFAGLIPPVLLTFLVWRGAGGEAAGLLESYAALILSFLGGTWWAFACREARPSTALLSIAVVPSLAGWAALGLLVPSEALFALAAMLLGALLVDGWLVRRRLAPFWWMGLRVPLSLGLAICAALSGWALVR